MDWLVRWHLVYDAQLSLPGHTISHNRVFNLYQELLLVDMSSQNKKAGTYPSPQDLYCDSAIEVYQHLPSMCCAIAEGLRGTAACTTNWPC